MHYEDILHRVGHFGKYQKLVIVLVSMIEIPTACHFLAQVFLAASTDHWCMVPASQAVNCSRLQLDSVSTCQEAQKNESIPYELDADGNRVYSSCERYSIEEDISDNATDVIACDAGWDFDRSRYKSTINEEFNLVCDREDFAGIAQCVWFAGLLTGSLVWGSVGDWLGRRKTFFLSLTLVSISSIVTAFVPSFAAFTTLRFFTAACACGAAFMTFVISLEIVGASKRVLVGTVAAIMFALGYIFLSFFAYFIREWRHLQLAISLPYVVAFLLLLVFPESPRWLISKGRFTEARQIIAKIAKVNGTEVPVSLLENLENFQDNEKDHKPKSFHRTTLLDLFRTPNIRKKTFIIFFAWSVGLGASSMAARISGILCPIILILGKYWEPLPLCVFGGGSVLAGLLSLILPETLCCDMPDTVQDGEDAGLGLNLGRCCQKESHDSNDSKPLDNYLPLSTIEKSRNERAV